MQKYKIYLTYEIRVKKIIFYFENNLLSLCRENESMKADLLMIL